MEHRCTNRYISDLNIKIYQHRLPIALGRIKNASLAGVFIETEFAEIDCEHQVSIEICHNRSRTASLPLRIQALIIHKCNNGFGAELDISSNEQADFFSKLLIGYQVAKQPMLVPHKLANG